MNKKFRYQHIYSSVSGKTPSATTLLVGEIAVNGFADDEKLFIKNTSGDVVDFPRSYSIKDIDEDMEVIAAALNDLNIRKQEKLIAGSGITITEDNIISAETGNKVYEVTQAEYDAMEEAGTLDLEAFYIITDAEPITIPVYSGSSTIDIDSANTVSSLVYLKKITTDLPANVKERFQLVDANGDNIVTVSGDTSDHIDVYKDSSIVEIYLGTEWDSVSATTGEIDKKEIGDEVEVSGETHIVDDEDFHFLNYVYFSGGFSGGTISGDSEYKMTQVDVSKLLSITDYDFDSGSTRPLANSAITMEFISMEQEIRDDMETVSAALNDLETRKQEKLIAGSGITISGNVISSQVTNLDTELDSGSTNAVMNSAITMEFLAIEDEIDEDMETISSALNDLETRKQEKLIAGEGITISGNVISSQVTNLDTELDSGSTNAVMNSAITMEFISMEQEIKDDMETVSAALNDLETRKQEKLIAGSGITIDSANTISCIGGAVDVDPTLDSGSTNAVANSAITLALDEKMDKQSFINSLYPKGSIYVTSDYTNPSTFIGGEWELIGGEDASKNYYPAFAIATDSAGTTISESLPNIKGDVNPDYSVHTSIDSQITGAFTRGATHSPGFAGGGSNSNGFSFDASKGQVEADGTTYVASTASTYQNGAQVNVNAIKLFFWRRFDDAIIVESFSAVTLDIVRDTLWEGSATSGNISLSGKMSDYDELEFVFDINSQFTVSELVAYEILSGSTKYLFSFTGGDARWGNIYNIADTSFTLATNGITLKQVIGKKDAYVSRSLEIETNIDQYSTNDKAAGAKAVYDFLSGVNIVVCTQQEYDDMETHNPQTLYIIND